MLPWALKCIICIIVVIIIITIIIHINIDNIIIYHSGSACE